MNEALLEQCERVLEKNHLHPIRRLGKGAFGTVFLVSEGGDMDLLYSVKCTYKKQFSKKPVLRKYLKQQIELMQSLDHPGIVKLHRSFEDDGWIFMVLQYCDLGNLSMVQTLKKSLIFSYQEFSHILSEVLDAVDYLHSQNIIHRDIKPENILMTTVKGCLGKKRTKICDFGFSRQIEEDVSTICGTTYFMAPQIFGKNKYDKSVDIWALGVLAFVMLFGSVPFKSVNMELEINNKCKKGFDLVEKKMKTNPSIGKTEMKALSELFNQVFQLDPEKRPSISKIRKILFLGDRTLTKSIETDASSEEEMVKKSFELTQVEFIDNIQKQIKAQGFLTPLQFSILKYELSKVCISILSCGRKAFNISEKEERKIEELKAIQNQQLLTFKGKLKTINIVKLVQVFQEKKSLNFQEYKEEYRLIVGYAFSKAQKNITDYAKKMRIKLKLLCCHTINRVFEKEHRDQMFRHCRDWQKSLGKSQSFSIRNLEEWMAEESPSKIISTIDLINTRFYGKVSS